MCFRFLRPLDLVIFAVFAVAVAGSIFALATRPRGERTPLVVINTPSGEYVYPLNKNREIVVAGALGDSVLVIQDGRAFFKKSPCPNQICVQSSALEHNGEWSACLPNQIFMHIEHDGEETDLDALAS